MNENIALVRAQIQDYIDHMGTPSETDLKVWIKLIDAAEPEIANKNAA